MKRYQPPRHPVAFGLAALALTLITLGTLVAAPAQYDAVAADPVWAGASPGHDVVAVAVTCQRSGGQVVAGEN